MLRAEAQRLKTLRRRRDYLVRRLEQDDRPPGTLQRDYLSAEVGALNWALQELDEIRPELHSHTIRVVKLSIVAELRLHGVDESVVRMARDCCNRLTRRISLDSIDDVEDRFREFDNDD